jgi:molybdopterin-guanine dinucleotide biosynthesis protein A
MGTDKALLELGGLPLVVRAVRALADAVGEVVVVTRRPEALEGLGLEVVADDPGPQTPLTGIATALRRAGGRPVFFAACDMPWIVPAFVRALVALAAEAAPAGRGPAGWDAVVPLRQGRPEPLHALWGARARGAVDAALLLGRAAPRDVLRDLAVRWVPEEEWRRWDPGGRSLANVNTPADLEAEAGGRAGDGPRDG